MTDLQIRNDQIEIQNHNNSKLNQDCDDIFEINVKSIKKYYSHEIPLNELEKLLHTDFKNGLTSSRVKFLQKKLGKNEVVQSKIRIFLKEIFSRYWILLWISCICLFVIYFLDSNNSNALYLGLLSLLIILISNLFIVYKKEQIFSQLTLREIYALRDGKRTILDVRELVDGDIIYLKNPDYAPADIRIIEGYIFQNQNNYFTNHKKKIEKISYLNSQNVLYQGTKTKNYVIGVVIKTGKRTSQYYLTRKQQGFDIDYSYKCTQRTKWLNICGLLLGIFFFILTITLHFDQSLLYMISYAISVYFVCFPVNIIISELINQNVLIQKFTEKGMIVYSPQFQEYRRRIIKKQNKIILFLSQGAFQRKFYVDKVWFSGKEQQKSNFNINNLDFQMLIKCLLVANGIQLIQSFSQKSIYSQSSTAILKFISMFIDLNSFKQINYFKSIKYSDFQIVEEEQENSYYTIYYQSDLFKVMDVCSYMLVDGIKVRLKNNDKNQIFDKCNPKPRDTKIVALAKLELSKVEYPRGCSNFPQNEDQLQKHGFVFCGMVFLEYEIEKSVLDTFQKLKQQNVQLVYQSYRFYDYEEIKRLLIKYGLINNDMRTDDELIQQGFNLEDSIKQCLNFQQKKDKMADLQIGSNQIEIQNHNNSKLNQDCYDIFEINVKSIKKYYSHQIPLNELEKLLHTDFKNGLTSSRQIFSQLTISCISTFRDGKNTILDMRELVEGDLIYMNSNEYAPADIRVITAGDNFQDQNNYFTNHKKKIETISYLNSQNVLYQGTLTKNYVLGVVIKTGKRTSQYYLTRKQQGFDIDYSYKCTQRTKWLNICGLLLGIFFFTLTITLHFDQSLLYMISQAISVYFVCFPVNIIISELINQNILIQKFTEKGIIVYSPQFQQYRRRIIKKQNKITLFLSQGAFQRKFYVDKVWFSGKEQQKSNFNINNLDFQMLIKCLLVTNGILIDPNLLEEEQENSYYTIYYQSNLFNVINICSYMLVDGIKVRLKNNVKNQIFNMCYPKPRDTQIVALAKLELNKVEYPRGCSNFPQSVDELQRRGYVFCGMVFLEYEIKKSVLDTFQKLKQQNVQLVYQSYRFYDYEEIKRLLIKYGLINNDMRTDDELFQQGFNLEDSIKQCEILFLNHLNIDRKFKNRFPRTDFPRSEARGWRQYGILFIYSEGL
ncbi:hypothetical protein ABPG73_004609 [Tetrahymena malaccensis]